jgi:hypothetical protein
VTGVQTCALPIYKEGGIPNNVLHDDAYFMPFKLKLPGKLPDQPNRFKGLNYATLGEYQTPFNLRPIRNVIVKQNSPKDDDSSVYEIFNRLNSGGINLRPQEIRTSLYHSDFYEMLHRLNAQPAWRRLTGRTEADLHMKDVEVLLRGFAMLVDGKNYAPSMVKFLNGFSKKCKRLDPPQNAFLEKLFEAFLVACTSVGDDVFRRKSNGRFNIALFEAVFAAACSRPFIDRTHVVANIEEAKVRQLEGDGEFGLASLEGTTKTANVEKRLERANAILLG